MTDFPNSVLCAIHLSHAAFTNRHKNFVRAEFIAYRERHVMDSIQFSRSERGLCLDDGALGSYSTLTTPPRSYLNRDSCRRRVTWLCNAHFVQVLTCPIQEPARRSNHPLRRMYDGPLHIMVNVFPRDGGSWPCSIQTELEQAVTLERNTMFTIAPTWSVSEVGSVGSVKVRSIRESVKDQVDQFINAYLAVNPKK
jgi:hypothetical protein